MNLGLQGFWEAAAGLAVEEEKLLFDPQPSGGLLFAVPAGQCDDLLAGLKKAGIEAAAHVGMWLKVKGSL